MYESFFCLVVCCIVFPGILSVPYISNVFESQESEKNRVVGAVYSDCSHLDYCSNNGLCNEGSCVCFDGWEKVGMNDSASLCGNHDEYHPTTMKHFVMAGVDGRNLTSSIYTPSPSDGVVRDTFFFKSGDNVDGCVTDDHGTEVRVYLLLQNSSEVYLGSLSTTSGWEEFFVEETGIEHGYKYYFAQVDCEHRNCDTKFWGANDGCDCCDTGEMGMDPDCLFGDGSWGYFAIETEIGGFTGDDCSMTTCWGYNESDSENVCSGNGNCTDPNVCSCEGSHYGGRCDAFKCHDIFSSDPLVCSGNGRCESPDFCVCNDSYHGDQCDVVECYDVLSNSPDPLVCSGNGRCESPDFCVCEDSYFGIQCEVVDCNNVLSNSTNPLVCSGNGRCESPDFCICRSGYGGNDCEIVCQEDYDGLLFYDVFGADCEIRFGNIMVLSTRYTLVAYFDVKTEYLVERYNLTDLSREIEGEFDCSILLEIDKAAIVNGQRYREDMLGDFFRSCSVSRRQELYILTGATSVLKVYIDHLSEEKFYQILNHYGNRLGLVVLGHTIVVDVYPHLSSIEEEKSSSYTMRSFESVASDLDPIEYDIPKEDLEVCKSILEETDKEKCVALYTECYMEDEDHQYFSLGFYPDLMDLGWYYAKFYFESEEECRIGKNFVGSKSFSLSSCSAGMWGDTWMLYESCEGDVISNLLFNDAVVTFFFTTLIPFYFALFCACCFILCCCCYCPLYFSRKYLRKSGVWEKISLARHVLGKKGQDEKNLNDLLLFDEVLQKMVKEKEEEELKEMKLFEDGIQARKNRKNIGGSKSSGNDVEVKGEDDRDESEEEKIVLNSEEKNGEEKNLDALNRKEDETLTKLQTSLRIVFDVGDSSSSASPSSSEEEAKEEQREEILELEEGGEERHQEEKKDEDDEEEEEIIIEIIGESKRSGGSNNKSLKLKELRKTIERDKEDLRRTLSERTLDVSRSSESSLNKEEKDRSGRTLSDNELRNNISSSFLNFFQNSIIKYLPTVREENEDEPQLTQRNYYENLHRRLFKPCEKLLKSHFENDVDKFEKSLLLFSDKFKEYQKRKKAEEEEEGEGEEEEKEGKSNEGFMKSMKKVCGCFLKVGCFGCCVAIPGFLKVILLTIFILIREGFYLWFASSDFLGSSDVDATTKNFVFLTAILEISRWVITGSIIFYLAALLFMIMVNFRFTSVDPFMFCFGIGSLREFVVFRIFKALFIVWFMCVNLFCYLTKFHYLDELEKGKMRSSPTFYFNIIFPEVLLMFNFISVLSYDGVSNSVHLKKLKKLGCKGFLKFPKVKISLLKCLNDPDAILESFFQILHIVEEGKEYESEIYLEHLQNTTEYGHMDWKMLKGLDYNQIMELKEFFFPMDCEQETYWHIFATHRISTIKWLRAALCFSVCCFFEA